MYQLRGCSHIKLWLRSGRTERPQRKAPVSILLLGEKETRKKGAEKEKVAIVCKKRDEPQGGIGKDETKVLNVIYVKKGFL